VHLPTQVQYLLFVIMLLQPMQTLSMQSLLLDFMLLPIELMQCVLQAFMLLPFAQKVFRL
jgi:hypothetical protein